MHSHWKFKQGSDFFFSFFLEAKVEKWSEGTRGAQRRPDSCSCRPGWWQSVDRMVAWIMVVEELEKGWWNWGIMDFVRDGVEDRTPGAISFSKEPLEGTGLGEYYKFHWVGVTCGALNEYIKWAVGSMNLDIIGPETSPIKGMVGMYIQSHWWEWIKSSRQSLDKRAYAKPWKLQHLQVR